MEDHKKLVIVESPAKAKTISRILGDSYAVVPSMGHVIDLPKKELGVDIEKGFEPSYVVMAARRKMLSQLKKDAKGADVVYIVTDPDREGEAIGWHIRDRIFKDKKVYRIEFHEITQSAIKNAFSHPRDFSGSMIEAQISRRILDRIVGYYLSPLLWKKVARGLSAGRVQSVALRLIVDRERAIREFVPQEYWEIDAELAKKGAQPGFKARLDKIGEKKAEIGTGVDAQAVCDRLVPGIPERMRHEGTRQTPFAALSRGVCGVRNSSLILNLPGNPKAALESLAAVVALLPHALDLLKGKTQHKE
jgi:DNA topoisomerase-1